MPNSKTDTEQPRAEDGRFAEKGEAKKASGSADSGSKSKDAGGKGASGKAAKSGGNGKRK